MLNSCLDIRAVFGAFGVRQGILDFDRANHRLAQHRTASAICLNGKFIFHQVGHQLSVAVKGREVVFYYRVAHRVRELVNYQTLRVMEYRDTIIVQFPTANDDH